MLRAVRGPAKAQPLPVRKLHQQCTSLVDLIAAALCSLLPYAICAHLHLACPKTCSQRSGKLGACNIYRSKSAGLT